MKILLIDDTVELRENVFNRLTEKVSGDVEIIKLDENNLEDYIPKDIPSSKDTHAPEDLLAERLEGSDIDLIVVDHDLSKLKSNLSEPVVSIASHAATIPLCRYARVRRKSSMSKLSDAIEAGTTFSIKINNIVDDAAIMEIIEVLYGFKNIKEAISKLDTHILQKGPAFILAYILDDTTQEKSIAQYTISSNILNEVLELHELEKEENFEKEEIKKIKINRLTYIIGYWLYNSILKFPGVILNKKATCSYLNINEDDFENNKQFFDSAKYTGFFSKFTEYWWKDRLNTLLDDSDVWSGKELLEKELKKEIQPCFCSSNSELEAGYFCVIKREPISEEESIGGMSWLPKGANLCRATKNDYEQIAPLLGI
jgi:hypothetical protein